MWFGWHSSGEFGVVGEDGDVFGEAAAVLGGRMRVGRVHLRANVLGADFAVVGRLVDEAEVGADVVRAR